MNSESRIEASVSTDQTERIGGNIPGVASAQSTNSVPPTAAGDFADPAKNRKERIKKLEARLQREIARDNAATRKERNGQRFVWARWSRAYTAMGTQKSANNCGSGRNGS